MKKILLPIILIAVVALAGCPQTEQEICAQVITAALSPGGQCTEYPTPCDVPRGYTIVDSCPAMQEEEPQQEAPQEEQPEEPEEPPLEEPAEPQQERVTEAGFSFTSELKYCEYDSLLKKHTWFYQIRNYTDKNPTYGAKIWLKAEPVGKFQSKTIQAKYRNGQLLWEELQYTHTQLGAMRGQVWDIREEPTYQSLNYQLIYCEPEITTAAGCTPETGILLDDGNTSIDCRIAGQVE